MMSGTNRNRISPLMALSICLVKGLYTEVLLSHTAMTKNTMPNASSTGKRRGLLNRFSNSFFIIFKRCFKVANIVKSAKYSNNNMQNFKKSSIFAQ